MNTNPNTLHWHIHHGPQIPCSVLNIPKIQFHQARAARGLRPRWETMRLPPSRRGRSSGACGRGEEPVAASGDEDRSISRHRDGPKEQIFCGTFLPPIFRRRASSRVLLVRSHRPTSGRHVLALDPHGRCRSAMLMTTDAGLPYIDRSRTTDQLNGSARFGHLGQSP